MSIHHNFNSGKADSGDPTLINPSNWNDVHAIDAATILYSHVQNVTNNRVLGNVSGSAAAVSELTAAQIKTLIAIAPADVTFAATQRALGRNTAAGGPGEEVTAGQIFDWVSTTNGVLLTRTGAATWAAAANVAIDNGDLALANNASPVAPAAGNKLASMAICGRQMPVAIAASGAQMPIQPYIAQRRIMGMWPQAISANVQSLGITPSNTGTATARALATTNLQQSSGRIGYVSAAGANSVGGTRLAAATLWRGNGAGLGGFFYACRFSISDAVLVTTANMFVGLEASSAAPTDVAPSTLVNIFGVGCDNGDTHLQLYASGAVAQARTDLGANFPVNTTNADLFELLLFCYPNDTGINYVVTRLNTGNVTSGKITVSANLFSTTTFVCQQVWRSNGGTASAVGIDLHTLYSEADA